MSGSSPGLIYSQVPTNTEWNSYFAAKQDYSPILQNIVNAGGAIAPGDAVPITGGVTMTGAINIVAGAAGSQQPAQMAQIISSAGGTISGVVSFGSFVALESWSQTTGQGVNFAANTTSPNYAGSTIQSWLHTDVNGGFGVYHAFIGTNIPTTNLAGGALYSRMFCASAAGQEGGNTPVGITSEVFRAVGSDANDGTRNTSYSAVPRGNTTISNSVSFTGMGTIFVAAVDYFSLVYPTNGQTVQNTSSAYPNPVVVNSDVTLQCIAAVSTGGTSDTVKGATGPGHLVCTGTLSSTDGTAGHTVVSIAQGAALESFNGELRSYSGLPSSIDGALLGYEGDMSADGVDDGNCRSLVSLFYQEQVNTGTASEVQSFLKLLTQSAGYTRTSILPAVTYSQAVIDLRESTILPGASAHAIWLPDGAEIALDTAGYHRIGYNTFTGNIEFRLGTNSANCYIDSSGDVFMQNLILPNTGQIDLNGPTGQHNIGYNTFTGNIEFRIGTNTAVWPTINSGGSIEAQGLRCDAAGQFNGAIGFFGATEVGRQTVSGAKGGNAALASLITSLATLGLVTDSTTT